MDARIGKIVELAAYPVVTLLAMLGYRHAVAEGMAPGIAAYGAVAIAFALIAIHEIALPERTEWRPGAGEAFGDLVFLVVVHMLMPAFLTLVTVLSVAALVSAWGLSLDRLWPHHWPDWGQLVLLALLAELPRYWLHRWSHTWSGLWRFHAVHHAPKILYSLNVARFHPVDRALQFLVEVSPFIAVGVAPEVLSLYFVFYAVTGFYQHSNCRVRLGILNWVVAGPELHRWHHSVNPRESNSNYGNKLIVWDLVFGTRFLPSDRRVGSLGLLDSSYPTGFVGQILAPFIRRGSQG